MVNLVCISLTVEKIIILIFNGSMEKIRGYSAGLLYAGVQGNAFLVILVQKGILRKTLTWFRQ